MTNLLSTLATPSGVAYLLLLLGLLTVLSARTRRASWWLLAGSGLVSVVFSSGMVASALMSPLEYAYPRLQDARAHADVRRIVVLTGWAGDDRDMPLTGRLGVSSAYRVLMALELHSERPDCELIVSGNRQTAQIMGEALVKLGVPAEQLRLEDQSTTTAQSADMLKPMLQGDPFFLVTSAGHMPRALGVLRKQGLNPIPAPTDHQLPRQWLRAEWTPRPSSLAASDHAMHEYVGLVWYRLQGEL